MRATVEGVEPRFLTLDEILTLHETGIAEHGGSFGLRDRAALESCIEQPKQSSEDQYLYEYPLGMAAVYMRQLLQGHPFIDGNKRVALTACVTFLRLNGWALTAEDEAAAEAVRGFVTTGSDRDDIAKWLKKITRRLPSLELRSFMARLNYRELAEFFESGLVHEDPVQGQAERANTMLEAARAIPAVNQANLGAVHAEESGDVKSAELLRGQSLLLSAIYRLAEDQGYKW